MEPACSAATAPCATQPLPPPPVVPPQVSYTQIIDKTRGNYNAKERATALFCIACFDLTEKDVRANGNGSFADNLKGKAFIHCTPSGHMDEVGFYKFSNKFIAAVGKRLWDKNYAWDDQPASRGEEAYMFEPRPIIWLLDAHYSHKYARALELLRDHDVHVFFTASGASEVDQICDCGVMAHGQAKFGEYAGDWNNKNPGKEFLPSHWNFIFQQTCDSLARDGSRAIISAARKTGWYPYNRDAENYQQIKDVATFVDPQAGERMVAASKATGYSEMRETKHEQANVIEFKARKPDGGVERLMMREKAVGWFQESRVTPAKENLEMDLKILKGRQSKPVRKDPEPTDGEEALKKRHADTAFGAWGSAEEFIADCSEGLDLRLSKVDAAVTAKEKKEESARLKHEQASKAAVILEEAIAGGKTIPQLKNDELKALIVGRGGKLPTNKSLGRNPLQADLRAAVEALPPMTAQQQLLATQMGSAPAAEAAAEVDTAVEEAGAHPEAPPLRRSRRHEPDDGPDSPGGDRF